MSKILEFSRSGGVNEGGREAYNCFYVTIVGEDGEEIFSNDPMNDRCYERIIEYFGENVNLRDDTDYGIAIWNNSGLIFENEEDLEASKKELAAELQHLIPNEFHIEIDVVNELQM